MVQYDGLLPVDRVVVLPCMFRYSWLHHHPPLTGIPVFLQSRLQFPFGLSDVDLGAAVGDTIYHIGLFTMVNIEQRVHPNLKDYSDVELPANTPDVLTHPSHIGYHHHWSLLLLLSLVWAVCCFLWRQGRGIADEVCRITILLENSSWSPWLLDHCDEEGGREEQSSLTFDL